MSSNDNKHIGKNKKEEVKYVCTEVHMYIGMYISSCICRYPMHFNFCGFIIRGICGLEVICRRLHLRKFRSGSCTMAKHGCLRI
jgi:putative Mn2+ efflux pump MntP